MAEETKAPEVKMSDIRTAFPNNPEICAPYRFARLNGIQTSSLETIMYMLSNQETWRTDERDAPYMTTLKKGTHQCTIYESIIKTTLEKWQRKESKIKRLLRDGLNRMMPF